MLVDYVCAVKSFVDALIGFGCHWQPDMDLWEFQAGKSSVIQSLKIQPTISGHYKFLQAGFICVLKTLEFQGFESTWILLTGILVLESLNLHWMTV